MFKLQTADASPPDPHINNLGGTDLLILNSALQKVIMAVARLRRAGPTFRHKSEAFWIFAAGFVRSRQEFDRAVREEGKRLRKTMSVEEDLAEARRLVNEALGILRRAEVEDAWDLSEAIGIFEGGD